MLLSICGGGVAGLYTGPPMPWAQAILLARIATTATAVVFTTWFTISPLMSFASPGTATGARDRLVPRPESSRLCVLLLWTHRQSALHYQVDRVLHRDMGNAAVLVDPARRIQLLLHRFAILVQVGHGVRLQL